MATPFIALSSTISHRLRCVAPGLSLRGRRCRTCPNSCIVRARFSDVEHETLHAGQIAPIDAGQLTSSVAMHARAEVFVRNSTYRSSTARSRPRGRHDVGAWQNRLRTGRLSARRCVPRLVCASTRHRPRRWVPAHVVELIAQHERPRPLQMSRNGAYGAPPARHAMHHAHNSSACERTLEGGRCATSRRVGRVRTAMRFNDSPGYCGRSAGRRRKTTMLVGTHGRVHDASTRRRRVSGV